MEKLPGSFCFGRRWTKQHRIIGNDLGVGDLLGQQGGRFFGEKSPCYCESSASGAGQNSQKAFQSPDCERFLFFQNSMLHNIVQHRSRETVGGSEPPTNCFAKNRSPLREPLSSNVYAMLETDAHQAACIRFASNGEFPSAFGSGQFTDGDGSIGRRKERQSEREKCGRIEILRCG